MFSLRFAVLAVFALLAAIPAFAEDKSSVLIVSLPSLDQLEADAGYLSHVIEDADLPRLLTDVWRRSAGVDRLEGMDRTGRWGIVVMSDGLSVVPFVCLPVADGDRLLASLRPLIGKPMSQEEGILKVGEGELTGFLRYQQGWLYSAQLAQELSSLPDPATLDVPVGTDIAITASISKWPEGLRTIAVDALRVAASAERPPQAAVPLPPLALQAISQVLTDAGEVSLTAALDAPAETTTLRVQMTPREGTDFSGLLQKLGLSMPLEDDGELLKLSIRMGTWAQLGAGLVEQGQLRTMLQLASRQLSTQDDRATMTLETSGDGIELRVTGRRGVIRTAALLLALAARQLLAQP